MLDQVFTPIIFAVIINFTVLVNTCTFSESGTLMKKQRVLISYGLCFQYETVTFLIPILTPFWPLCYWKSLFIDVGLSSGIELKDPTGT